MFRGALRGLALALGLVLGGGALADYTLVDLAKETTATVGDGATLVVGGADTGFLTIEAAATQAGKSIDGATVHYGIVDGNNRESGPGTYDAGTNTLTRCTSGVNCTSTNGGNRISLSGSAKVGITAIATSFDELIAADTHAGDVDGIYSALDLDEAAVEAELEGVLDVADLQGYSAVLTEAEAAAAYQPLDADLTSWAGVTRASGYDTFAATPSSANLRSLLTDEVDTGVLVFLGTPADDQVPVGDSASDVTWRTIPDCNAAADVLNYDQATNTWSCGVDAGEGGGLTAVVDDTDPELGGGLDLNTFDITGTGNINITGAITASTDVTATDDLVAGDDIQLSAGALIDMGGGDVVITFTANDLAFTGVTGDYSFDDTVGITGSLTASVDVTATAGDVTAGDDLIATDDIALSNGGTISFGAGDCDLTEGTNTLTISGTCTLVTEVVTPDGDNTRDLGSTGATWATAHINSIELANGTANTLTATGGTLSIEGVALIPDATNSVDAANINFDYVGTVADGTGVDGTATGEGSTYTPTLDLTEITSMTWGNGNFTTETYSGAGAIDLTWTYSTSATAILSHNDAGAVGPIFRLFHDSATPADGDIAGEIQVSGGADDEVIGQIQMEVDDGSTGSEDTHWDFVIRQGGADTLAMTLDGNSVYTESGNFFAAQDDAGATGSQLILWHDSATPADGDIPGAIYVTGGADDENIGIIKMELDDGATTTEDTQWQFVLRSAGSDLTALTLSANGAEVAATVPATGLSAINTDAGAAGAALYLNHDSASEADNDVVAQVEFWGRDDDDTSIDQRYGYIWSTATDVSDATEDSTMRFGVVSAGSDLTALTLGTVTVDGAVPLSSRFYFGAVPYAGLELVTDADDGEVSGFAFVSTDAGRADNESVGFLTWQGKDDGGNYVQYAYIDGKSPDVSNGTEDGSLGFHIQSAGSDLTALTLGGTFDGEFVSYFNASGTTGFPGIVLESDNDGAVQAPFFYFYKDSPTPADNDTAGAINFTMDDDTNALAYLGGLTYFMTDVTNGTVDSSAQLTVKVANSFLTALTLGDTTAGFDGAYNHRFDLGSADYGGVVIYNTSAADGGPTLQFYANSATPTTGDNIGYTSYWGEDSAGNQQLYAVTAASIVDTTSTSEDGQYRIRTMSGGSLITALNLGGYAADTGFDTLFGWDDSVGYNKAMLLADIGTEAAPAAGDYVLIYGAEGDLRKVNWSGLPGAGGGIGNVVEDTTPQLGGDLDLNNFSITDASLTVDPVMFFNDGEVLIYVADDSAQGALLSFHQDSASPADGDIPFQLRVRGGVDDEAIGIIRMELDDGTSGSEDTRWSIIARENGTDYETVTVQGHVVTLCGITCSGAGLVGYASGNNYEADLYTTDAGAAGPILGFAHDSATPADGDIPAKISVYGGADDEEIGSIKMELDDGATGTEDTLWQFVVRQTGADITSLSVGSSDDGSVQPSQVFIGGSGIFISAQYDATFGAFAYLNNAEATMEDNDILGTISFSGNDDGGSFIEPSQIKATVTDSGTGSIDSTLAFSVNSANSSLTALTLGGTSATVGTFAHIFDFGSAEDGILEIASTAAGANGPNLVLSQQSGSAAVDDEIGLIQFIGRSNAAANRTYAINYVKISDTTNTAEDGRQQFDILAAGSLTTALQLGDVGFIKFHENDTNGDEWVMFTAPASLTADRTCTLQDSGPPIPDSCVGDGTDGGGSQTPWGSNIDAADFDLTELDLLEVEDIELGVDATDTSIARTAAGEASIEGDAIKHAGKQMIWVSAGSMKSNVTSPASCGDTYDSGSNDLTISVCAFDTGATEERADFQIAMPKSWNEGTVTFIPISVCTGCSASQTIQYELACAAVSHDDTLNSAMGTAQTSSVTVTATNDSQAGAESSAITCANTPAENDIVAFRISRDTSVDNGAGDALLIGLKLFWTDNASTLAE